ncbi:MAG: hypothetical protein ACXWKW_11830 [Asticcacaulis sp.]
MNLRDKKTLKAEQIRLFVQQYARKAQKGVEPNDRRYDRELEKDIKRMRPDELDELLRLGETDEPSQSQLNTTLPD